MTRNIDRPTFGENLKSWLILVVSAVISIAGVLALAYHLSQLPTTP